MSDMRRNSPPVEQSSASARWVLAKRDKGGLLFYYYDDDDGNPVFGNDPCQSYLFYDVDSGKSIRDSLEADGIDVSGIDVRKVRMRMDVYTRWKPASEMFGRG